MSDYLSGQISFTGLGSGTDFQSMIEKLIEIEGNHKKQLESWRVDWEQKVEAIQELNSSMLSLKSTLTGMDTPSEFLTKSTSSSNESVLTATADSDADEGTHNVEVYQLAQNEVEVNSNAVATTSTSINSSGGAQTFAYKYDGNAEVQLSVADGTTLSGLVDLINSDPDNPGVRASAITDGTSYYLQIRGMDLGADNTIAITSNSTLTNYQTANFQETQTAQNAQIKVNGWPTAAGDYIESDTNTIADAIEGVTLSLKSLSASPTNVQISVGTDTEGIKENVRTFVDQVNEVRSIFLELTEFDELSEQGSVMTGNYAVQLVSSQLKSAVAGLGKGFEYYDVVAQTGDYYSALSQVGILTDAEEGSPTQGLLVLDEAALDEALDTNPDAVADLFAADYAGDEIVSTGNFSYYNHVEGITKAGKYDVAYDIDGAGNITNATINGQAATIDNSEGTITATHADDAKGLVVKVNDFTPNSSGSGTVQLKLGKAGEIAELLSDLTNSTSGPLHILEDNYDEIMDNIDKKIEYEESRLARMQRDLINKFARLEATLGYYDQISGALSNQIGQLDSN
jgi:flagellar hook-associated protein 2